MKVEHDVPVLTREQARFIDRQAIDDFGIPEILLMENAGRSISDFLLAETLSVPVLVVCGKGNNGGDGIVAARHLANHGISVCIALCADPNTLQGSTLTNFTIAKKSGIEIIPVSDNQTELPKGKFSSDGWIIDALLGTGLQGRVGEHYEKIIQSMNRSARKILAVDIPSGLDCDSGVPLSISVKADVTLTVAAMKKGFLNPDAGQYTGEVHIIDAGFPRRLFQQ